MMLSLFMLPLFPALLPSSTSGLPTKEPSGACVRHLDSHYILNLAKNFHHIDFFAGLINKLRSDKVITEFTYAILIQRLSQSTHDNCHLPVRHKRQAAAVAGTLFFIGGAVISPLLGRLLHPDYATAEDMMKTNSFLTDLAHHINDLEDRVRYLERQSEILELLMGIMLALEVEQEKFTELKSRDTFSTSINHFLEPVRDRYEELGIMTKSPVIDIQEDRLPHSTWKLSVKMMNNQNCSKASLQVAVYAAVPSKECSEVEESTADYVVLKTTNRNCLVLPPLTTMTLLPDNTLFSTTNYYVVHRCNITGLNFNFEYKNGVFLAVPAKTGAAIGDCGDVHTLKLQKEDGVAVNVGCSAYISSSNKKPKISDLYGPRIKAWSVDEAEIEHIKQDSFLFIDEDHIEVPDEQEPLDGEFSPSLSTTRTTGEGVETKMLFGICGTIGCATTAFLAWRLAKRLLAPLLQEKKSQPRRPQIVIVHKDPLLEDLRRSDELIKELRAVTELPPITSSSSFNSSTTLGENGSMLADALVHNEGAITMAQPTTRRSSLPALQEQSNNRRASY